MDAARDLVRLPGGTGPDAVGALWAWLGEQLADPDAWGRGPVALMGRAEPARITQPLDDVDVVIQTSGSTDGRGHLVGLSLHALTASALSTKARLGGEGQWVTSLPVDGVAGFQVVLRSALAGLEPVVYAPDGGVDAELFAGCVARLRSGTRHHLSLVPTQLVRLLDVAPGLLTGFDAILVGGAALAPDVARRAEEGGVRIVRTYGSTETSGGCVYDGVPLDGVRADVEGGRIRLGGPTLATRYLDTDEQPFAEEGGVRWLVTNDLGEWRDGRLVVRGRADDVIISGGANVNPSDVEAALATLGGQWVVVGVPDAEWGQRVVAVTDAQPAPTLEAVRAATATLLPASRPRQVVRLEPIPVRPTGKIDRRATASAVLATVEG